MDYSLAGAALVGLLGAGHCFAMCGALVGALSGQIPLKPDQHALGHILQFQLCYSAGRIGGYTLAGALCGGISGGLGLLFSLDSYLIVLRLLAGTLMILTGLYIAQIWGLLARLEQLGNIIWRPIAPLAKRVLPVTRRRQAITAGFLWGWLPCGLVYSMLSWAMASGSALNGALIMLFFGAGTLPALLIAGVAAKNLALWLQKKAVRIISGLVLIALGGQTLYVGLHQLI